MTQTKFDFEDTIKEFSNKLAQTLRDLKMQTDFGKDLYLNRHDLKKRCALSEFVNDIACQFAITAIHIKNLRKQSTYPTNTTLQQEFVEKIKKELNDCKLKVKTKLKENPTLLEEEIEIKKKFWLVYELLNTLISLINLFKTNKIGFFNSVIAKTEIKINMGKFEDAFTESCNAIESNPLGL